MNTWQLPSDGLLDGTDDEPAEPAGASAPVAGRDRHPYQSDVDYLREIGARLDINGSTGEPTSGPVLDAGRFGMEFFRRFGPSYAAVTGTRQDAFLRRYDAEREINYQRLREDVRRHDEVQAALAERIIDFRNGASPVFEAWEGEAAALAKGRFDGFLTRAEQVRAQFADLSGVLAAAVDAADRAVYEKAAGVADLWTDHVGALTAEDLEFVIDFGRRCDTGNPGTNVDDDELRRVAGFCGIEVNPVLCRLNPEVFGQVAADVRGWLESVFVPFYDARVRAFEALCASADTVVGGAWQAVSRMLDDVSGNQFADLFADQPSASAPVVPVTAPITPPSTPSTTPQSDSAAQVVAPAAAVDDRPVPDTPANRPGGISSALDGTSPDPATDTSDDGMHPMAAAPMPTPVAPAAPAAPVQQGNTFFGTPFFGGAGSRGGGDTDHKRSVPVVGEPFRDTEPPPEHQGHVIGASDDESLYNDDATQAADEPKPKKSLLDELRDEDLW